MIQQHSSKETATDTVGLFILALIARAVACYQGFQMLGDSDGYLDIAHNVAAFNSFAVTNTDNSISLTAFRPPLYPFLISLFWRDEAPIGMILALQCLMGAATVTLTYLTAREYFSRRIALISSLLVSFSPFVLYYTATIMTETLFALLFVLGVFLLIRSKFIYSGAVFGLAFLTRPIVLPFLLLAVLASLVFDRRRHAFLNYAVVVVIALLVASPWMIRNSLLLGGITLTQSSGYGTNLLYGTTQSPLWKDNDWSNFNVNTVVPGQRAQNEIEEDRRRMREALSRIQDSPTGWLKVRLQQFPLLFIDNNGFLLGENNLHLKQAFYEEKFGVVFVKVFFIGCSIVLFLLACLGIISIGRGLGKCWLVWLVPVFFAAMHLPFWVEPRYFLPALPAYYVLATVGMFYAAGRIMVLRSGRLPIADASPISQAVPLD
jgi:4-amino-4-deoxy-L-arabinose transferase-like glycosyltransferase